MSVLQWRRVRAQTAQLLSVPLARSFVRGVQLDDFLLLASDLYGGCDDGLFKSVRGYPQQLRHSFRVRSR